MKVPEGFRECLAKEFKNECAMMKKAAYILEQAKRQYYKKFVKISTKRQKIPNRPIFIVQRR